jgi:hypothetical protein
VPGENTEKSKVYKMALTEVIKTELGINASFI